MCVSVSSERPAAQQQTSVCRSLVSPRTVLSSTHTPSRAPETLNTLAALSDTTYDPETTDACWSDGVLLAEEEDPGSLGAEPEAEEEEELGSLGAEPEVEEKEEPGSLGVEPEAEEKEEPGSLGVDPETKEEEPGSLGAEPETTSDHYKPSRLASSSSALFKTPKPPRCTDPYGPLARFLGRSSVSFSVYTDPPAVSRAVSRSAKTTAPLCGCGRRARRLTVGNGGPNHGRGFYCCPVRRQACGFFKWESGLIGSSTQNRLRTPQTCGSRPLR